VVVVVVGGVVVVVVVGGGSVVVVTAEPAGGGTEGACDGVGAAGPDGGGDAGDAIKTACGAGIAAGAGAAGRANSARANPSSCWRCDSWAVIVTSRRYSCEISSALLKLGAFARGGPARAKPAATPTTASMAMINFDTMRSPL